MNDEMFGIPDAQRNTYWCEMVMVRPDWQGKGVGKALFQLAFREAEKTGVPVTCPSSSDRNVSSRASHVVHAVWLTC